MAFADVLKLYLEQANPLVVRERDHATVPLLLLLDEHNGDWDAVKRENPHVRQTLTSFGHGARIVFGIDFWAMRFLDMYQVFLEEHVGEAVVPTVITDVRYGNELDILRNRFGSDFLAMKIVRPGYAPDGHPSEDGLPDELFDIVIENNGSLSDLYTSVNSALALNSLALSEAATTDMERIK
ncbi:hypothetical protein ACIOHC_35815 [Streptomyces sp. NPDC088252]|uniref:deoxynucleotide monophosphate kinase family protein n=1 Tax=Streptomyces sp. NPDC088252 TaxID=3365845 RepID=UPI0038248238